ncbi:tail assembly protein [Klebsiella variicola]|uniref:tail assembly protein n=1 Tax=Klebsiella variicola TaxID=244366 RepID=UPI00155FE11E|nr:tail assembly protein [Klebsiella variicola]NRE95121.1 tail assembly protein [Klebsiella variicola]GKO12536.1 phage tail protein [Klebsiella variicola]HCI9332252.1 tail assembly protein [Klebsiella variicola]
MSELVHVQLGGALANRFGRHWHLRASNAAQAINLIDANKPGLNAWIRRNAKVYDRYHIQITTKSGATWSVDETEYMMKGAGRDVEKIRITPIPKGRGGKTLGYVQVAIGAVMIVAGAFLEGITAGTSSALVVAGMSMMMGGLAQILSPQAKNPEVRQADNSESFYFDGPQNTTNQGNPVQLNYGEEILVGSQIASSSITIDQI